MRFLKALQKLEVGDNADAVANGDGHAAAAGVNGSKMPALLDGRDLKIGGPNSVIRKRSNGGTATVSEPAKSATSTVDVVTTEQPAPEAEHRFLEFTVDPAAVNPHLVAITRPQSSYCEEY